MQKWKKISEEPIRIGFRTLLRRIFRLPEGEELEFVVKDDGKAVCVLALTPERQVILAEQFRTGPERVLLELPGGMIEKGEAPIEAAMRELREETGYEGELVFVGTHLSCAYSTNVRHVFVATNCRRVSEQRLDPAERIRIVEMALEAFRKRVRTGELTDVAGAYIALDHLGLL